MRAMASVWFKRNPRASRCWARNPTYTMWEYINMMILLAGLSGNNLVKDQLVLVSWLNSHGCGE
jgi:hypothetical protein